ncbi:MAG: Sir2 family NAD-dependent protein deacetylase [Planctomycetota bacterium]|nr:Sir2 family NAD-dependent protein deacetylase [Planctomycetota bacterium]
MLPDALIDRLRTARRIGVITGAGISAESGIQTYRGVGGLYDDPERGDRTVEALSAETVLSDPDRTWRVLAELARMAADAEPNAAHHALVEMEARAEAFTILTQNVDGLHAAAGTRNLIEIHGNIRNARCTRCPHRVRFEREDLMALDGTPPCPVCRSGLRPDAVLFGEMLPEREVAAMYRAFHVQPPEVVLWIGTSALFPYILDPLFTAQRHGNVTVEVNLERTDLSAEVDFALTGRAGDLVPAIAAVFGRDAAPECP